MKKLFSLLAFFFLCTAWTPVDPDHAVLHLGGADPYDFGTVEIGVVKIHSMMLGNFGGIDAVQVNGGGLVMPFRFTSNKPFPGGGGDCTSTLVSGKDCMVRIVFGPSEAGEFNSVLTITYFDGDTTETFDLPVHGIGVAPARANELVNTGEFAFGDVVVGESLTRTFTLSNSGTLPLYFYEFFLDFTKGQIGFDGSGDFPGTGTCTGDHIDPGQSCTYVMMFKPAAIAAVKSNFKINYYYNGKLQKQTVQFTGSGIAEPPPPPPAPALLVIDHAPTGDFGGVLVGKVSDLTFTVTNSGGSLATRIQETGLSAPFEFKGGVYPGIGGTCGESLAPVASCTITVTFTPTVVGPVSEAIQLDYYNGTSNSSAMRPIDGTGLSGAILKFVPEAEYDYGFVKVGTVKTQAFVIINKGDVPANKLKSLTLAPPFQISGGACAEVLQPGMACEIRVDFVPVKPGKYEGHLTMAYSNGLHLQSVTQDLHGIGEKKK